MFDITTPIILFIAGSFVREISKNNIWLDHVYTNQTPPTGLIGSATDAALLAITYFNNGILGTNRILSDESVRKMTYSSHVKKANDKNKYYMRQGIGWQVYKDRKGIMLQHRGWELVLVPLCRYIPKRSLALSMFANGTKCPVNQIVNFASGLEW